MRVLFEAGENGVLISTDFPHSVNLLFRCACVLRLFVVWGERVGEREGIGVGPAALLLWFWSAFRCWAYGK